jgi:hypothetical protein
MTPRDAKTSPADFFGCTRRVVALHSNDRVERFVAEGRETSSTNGTARRRLIVATRRSSLNP